MRIVSNRLIFDAGQVFAFRLESNWFSPAGATGTVIFRASVHR